MRSVGPFLLTDEEFSGLLFQLEQDRATPGTLKTRPGPRLIAGLDHGTGESGEAADVEADYSNIENIPVIPETITVHLRLEKPRMKR